MGMHFYFMGKKLLQDTLIIDSLRKGNLSLRMKILC